MTKSSRLIQISLNNKSAPIGIFDSGIGGLSILKEIQLLLPNQSILYLADQANFPYGNKTPKEIKNIASENVSILLAKKVKLVVVACNTATVNAIAYLRKKFPQIIFVGTEPAIKPAALLSKKGIIVLSSPQATKSKQLAFLINKYAKSSTIFNLSSLDLVTAVENQSSDQEIEAILEKDLRREIISRTDTLVLGCTHFSLIKDKLQKYVGRGIKIVDSCKAVATRTAFLLKENHLLPKTEDVECVYLTTGQTRVAWGRKFKSVGISLNPIQWS